MKLIFELLLIAAFVIAIIISPAAWVCMIYYLFRIRRSTGFSEQHNEISRPLLSRFRLQLGYFFDDSMFTPQGLRYRRKLVWAFLCFVIPIVLVFVLAYLAGVPIHNG